MAAAVFVCFQSREISVSFPGSSGSNPAAGCVCVCVCGMGGLGRLRGEFGVLVAAVGGGIQFSRRLDFGGGDQF